MYDCSRFINQSCSPTDRGVGDKRFEQGKTFRFEKIGRRLRRETLKFEKK